MKSLGKKIIMITSLMLIMSKPELLSVTVQSQEGTSFFKRAYIRLEKGMKTLCGDRSAFAAVLIGSILAVVVGSVMLYIGLFVSVTVYNAIPTGSLTAADNTTLAGVKTNVNTAFTILGIIMIVGGAAGIISVLLGFAGGRGGMR